MRINELRAGHEWDPVEGSVDVVERGPNLLTQEVHQLSIFPVVGVGAEGPVGTRDLGRDSKRVQEVVPVARCHGAKLGRSVTAW